MHRLFVAIEIPQAVRQMLALLQGGVPGARWVSPDNLHLTLRFIGDVSPPAISDLIAGLGQISAPGFTLQLEGVGSFGNGRTKFVLWAGVQRSDPLKFLRDKVDRAVVASGFAPDGRKFAPHITLAYAKQAPTNRLTGWLGDHALFRSQAIDVTGFALMESRRGGEGSVYTELARFDLA